MCTITSRGKSSLVFSRAARASLIISISSPEGKMRISISVDLLRVPAHDTKTDFVFGASFAPAFEWDDPQKPEPVPNDVFTNELKDLDAPDSNLVLEKRAGPLVPWTWKNVGVRVWANGSTIADNYVDLIRLPAERDIVPDSLNDIEKK